MARPPQHGAQPASPYAGPQFGGFGAPAYGATPRNGMGIAALVLGLVNAFIRPLLVILTFPVTLLTLGLFLFVINALMLWITSRITEHTLSR